MKHFTINKSLLYSFWHSSIMTIVKSAMCKDHYKYVTPSLVKSRVMPGGGIQDLSFYSIYQYLEAHQPLREMGGLQGFNHFCSTWTKIYDYDVHSILLYSIFTGLSNFVHLSASQNMWNGLKSFEYRVSCVDMSLRDWLARGHHELTQPSPCTKTKHQETPPSYTTCPLLSS